MLRTLAREGYTGEVASCTTRGPPEEACYREELAEIAGDAERARAARIQPTTAGDLHGRFGSSTSARRSPTRTRSYVCGPPELVDAVREHCTRTPRRRASCRRCSIVTAESSGGRVTFADSGVDVTDDGRPLLDQAEAAGLTPESGCRMGICFTCTRRKTSGAVRNVITGAVSSADEEDVQICVSAPVGDVDIAL